MPRPHSFVLASIACSGLAAAVLLAPATATAGAAVISAPSRDAGAVVTPVPGDVELGSVSSSSSSAPPTYADCEAAIQAPCYGPTQLERAYGTPALYARGVAGQGQTIVIVDPFGSPTIATDLATFDQAYGLPGPPSLKVIQPAGTYTWTPTRDQASWAGETTLDVEYAHAMAPKASILLVETPVTETEGTDGFPQIVQAEKYVIDHHLGGIISQSYNATEETFPTAQSLLALRGAYTDAYRHGVTVLGATGDSGATDAEADGHSFYPTPVIGWPASDPLVTAVGATEVTLSADGTRTGPDTAWNGSGGGVSSIFGRPSYQDRVASVTGRDRGTPDISMSGSCNTPVLTYSSFLGSGDWSLNCGTSVATPLFAGIVALSDQVAHHWLGLLNPALYALSARPAPGLVDVTTGDNSQTIPTADGGTTTVPGYSAGRGYDLVSGVGTIYAPAFVPALAFAARPFK
ncbi:MAG TPA: S53 family peptidase [Trebonia sp.]|nr:S53 family peptidase [Trebonia sp.]